MPGSREREEARSAEAERERVAAPEPVQQVAPALAPSASAVLAMQRGAGNHAVSRMIQRDLLDDVGDAIGNVGNAIGNAVGDAFDMRAGEEELDAQEELAEFRSTTLTPLMDYKPKSGLGQFDVDADMEMGVMVITLKVAYEFIDGDPAKVSAGFRPAEFKWTAAEKAVWKASYESEVSQLWSVQFQARSTKKHWESMVVDTAVVVVEDAADPHFKFKVAKYPDDAGMVQSSICPPGYHHNPAGGNCLPNTAADDEAGSAKMDSNDMRPEQKLDWGNAVTQVQFAEGSSELMAGPAGLLDPVITQLTTTAGSHVELTGRASATHRKGATPAEGAVRNMDLARERTQAVRSALLAGGVQPGQIQVRNRGQDGADTDAAWCRVDVQVGTQQTQNPALHETGHMLGSGDEYPETGSPKGTGVDTDYQQMITDQTGEVLSRDRTSDAMSVGSTVRRWNYAAFLEALKAITGRTDWTL